MVAKPDQEALKRAWEEYVFQERLRRDLIREEILQSWERSKGYKVNPLARANEHVLSENEFQQRQQANAELIETAAPLMERIYEFVAGSGFVVALADKEGCLLKVVGDKGAVEFTNRSNFSEGAKWGEKEAGTNAVALAIVLNKPVQVYGAEHWCLHAHTATCSAAPIHDPDTGEIIGVLDMTGRHEDVHRHTLGIVVAVASSIKKQLALKRAYHAAEMAHREKVLVLESMSEGVLTLDGNGRLVYMNRKAAQLLQLPFSEDWIGQPFHQLVEKAGEDIGYKRLIEIFKARKEVVDEILNVRGTGRSSSQFTVTVKSLVAPGGTCAGTVAVFQEISRVNRLVRQIGGWSARTRFDDLVGQDPAFQKALNLAKRAATSMCNVLLLGETGTGKDVLAQAIHNASPRRNQPFVAINCSVIPRELLASELFGYVEGAFTGAKKGGNPGKFELADGGTLFLDEIGEMPFDMQGALLRVLEERSIMRVGGGEVIPVDVRIIAATNRDLQREVSNGNFRRDLFFRLNVLPIYLPPLRQRKQDIPLLAQHLLQRACERMGRKVPKISPEVIGIFVAYSWPGNIREMQNVLERALHLLEGEVITVDLLPEEMRTFTLLDGSETEGALQSVEQATIIAYMEQYGGNRSLVAKKLGISRSTLYRKLKQYGLAHLVEGSRGNTEVRGH